MQGPSPETDLFREELQRVLASESFRSAEMLRKLLTYLAEVHLAGTGRALKEYMIGRDVMGKPEDYDPRVDASVRVQMGKLRQRLERYYTAEATGSRYMISIPKGHFALAFEELAAPVEGVREEAVGAAEPEIWRWVSAGLGLLVVVLALLLWRGAGQAGPANATVREFWRPFVETGRPAVVVLGSPMFVRFNTHYFRSPWANNWDEAGREIPLEELGKLLKSPTAPTPTYRWTPFGEAAAAFRLGVVLGPWKDLVLKRSTVLAWEDVRTSNLIFLGPAKFNRQLPELPVEQDFIIEQGAIQNLRPKPGEVARYQKPSAPDVEDIPEEYALITRMKGSAGWGEVVVLASTSTEGTWAAAEYLTNAESLAAMEERLRAAGAGLPENYQVVIKSRFKSQVPIHTEYVTHHVVRALEKR